MLEVKETLDAVVTEEDSGDRQLNQYHIKRVLGSGSFGTVHLRVEGRSRGASLTSSGGGHAAVTKAVQNPIDLVRGEIAILKKLCHRNIVKLFEVLDDPNQDSLFMVFELCEKVRLWILGLAKLLYPWTLIWPADICKRLFWELNIYMNMTLLIVPDNLLISGDGTLKIVDFGVSEIFTKETGTVAKSAGSPAFYSPEMCSLQHGDLSVKPVDIWAIGVTLYCMIYGKLPFSGNTVLDLYENIRSAEPTYPDDIDASLKNLFLKLLDKNPLSRITMDQLRVHAWVTDNDRQPLLPKNVNCSQLVLEVTQTEVEAAVKPIHSLFTVLKAVSKLKGLGRSASASTLPHDVADLAATK
ncbi:hypothetical protein BASA61_000008 [Batrachochytrium salamandrivorans]|nr:hypothetical protein BASA61_000008 [Batrachochytrium salamandrivorans]